MPITVDLYAVRQIGTNNYLPKPQGGGGRGGSHLEPVNFSKSHKNTTLQSMMPRMWATKAAAKAGLTAWLAGKVNCYRSAGGYYDDDWYDEDNELVPQAHRRRDLMEIVTITVSLPD